MGTLNDGLHSFDQSHLPPTPQSPENEHIIQKNPIIEETPTQEIKTPILSDPQVLKKLFQQATSPHRNTGQTTALSQREIAPREPHTEVSQVADSALSELKTVASLVQYAIQKPPMPEGLSEATKLSTDELRELSFGGCQFALSDASDQAMKAEELLKKHGVQNYSTLVLYNEKERTYRIIAPSIDPKSSGAYESIFRPDPTKRSLENLERLRDEIVKVRKESLCSTFPLYSSTKEAKDAPGMIKICRDASMPQDKYKIIIKQRNEFQQSRNITLGKNFQTDMLTAMQCIKELQEEAEEAYKNLEVIAKLAEITIQPFDCSNTYETSTTFKDGSTHSCNSYRELEKLVVTHLLESKPIPAGMKEKPYQPFILSSDEGHVTLAFYNPDTKTNETCKLSPAEDSSLALYTFFNSLELCQKNARKIEEAEKKLIQLANESPDIDISTTPNLTSNKDISIIYSAGTALIWKRDPITNARESRTVSLLHHDVESIISTMRNEIKQRQELKETLFDKNNVEITKVHESPRAAQNSNPNSIKCYIPNVEGATQYYLDLMDPLQNVPALFVCETFEDVKRLLVGRKNAKLVQQLLPDTPMAFQNISDRVATSFMQESPERFSLYCSYGDQTQGVTVKPGDDLNQKIAEFKAVKATLFQSFADQCKKTDLDIVVQQFTPSILKEPFSEGNLFRTYISDSSKNFVIVYRDPSTQQIKAEEKKTLAEVIFARANLREKQLAIKAQELEQFCESTPDIGFMGRFGLPEDRRDITVEKNVDKLTIQFLNHYTQKTEVVESIDLLTGDFQQAINKAREAYAKAIQQKNEVVEKLHIEFAIISPPPIDLKPDECRVYAIPGIFGKSDFVIFYLDPIDKKVKTERLSTHKQTKELVDFIHTYRHVCTQIPEARLGASYIRPIGEVLIVRTEEDVLTLTVNYAGEDVTVDIKLGSDNIQKKIQEFKEKNAVSHAKFEAEEKAIGVTILNSSFEENMLASVSFTIDTPPQIFRDATGCYTIAEYGVKEGKITIDQLYSMESVKERIDAWKSQASLRAHMKNHAELTLNPLLMATESKLLVEPVLIETSIGKKLLFEIKGFIPNTTEILSLRVDSIEKLDEAIIELNAAFSIGSVMRLSSVNALSSLSHFTDGVAAPAMTPELREDPLASLDILMAAFESIRWGSEQGSRNPDKLTNDGSAATTEEYKSGLSKYIDYVTNRKKMGAFSLAEQDAVYDELEARTRTLILDFTMKLIDSQGDPALKAKLLSLLDAYKKAADNKPKERACVLQIQNELRDLIKNAPPNSNLLDTFQSHVLWLCEAGLHCENRWKGDVANIYVLAKTGSLAGGESKDAELNVPDFLHHQIDQLKLGAVDEMVQETLQVDPRHDSSHGTYTMQNAVMRRGVQIPGVETIEKKDMYAWAGQSPIYKTDREIFDGFMSKCGAYNALKLVTGALNEHMGKQTQDSILRTLHEIARQELLAKNPDAQKSVASLEKKYAEQTAAIDEAARSEKPLTPDEKGLLEKLKTKNAARLKMIEEDASTDSIDEDITKLLAEIKEHEIVEKKSGQLKDYKELLNDCKLDVVTYQDRRTTLANRIFPQITNELESLLHNAGYLTIEEDSITLTPKYEITQKGALTLLTSLGFITEREGVKHHVLPKMKDLNERMEALQLESHRLEIVHLRAEANNERDLAESISEKKSEVAKLHEDLQLERIELAKKAYPDNPVFALAIPRAIGANTTFYTAAGEAKLHGIISRGIVFDESKPATMYDPNYQRKPDEQWEGLEMGQRGLYFSRDEVPYLGIQAPYALRLHTTSAIEGVSIPPVTELKKAGYSDEEINKGYDKIQKEFAFLQHEGLPPADTEVVFTKATGTLIPNAIIEAKDGSETVRSVTDYVTSKNLNLHPTWVKNDTSK